MPLAVAPTNMLNPSPSSPAFAPRFPRGLLYPALMAVLTLVPIVWTVWFLVKTGDVNPSSDDFRFFPLLNEMLEGRYEWRNYFRDTIITNGHSIAIPFLLYAAAAKFAALNVKIVLYFGVGVLVLKLLFLHAMIVRGDKGRLATAMWPILASLIFSLSQIDNFGASFYCLQYALNPFGFILAVWGMSRYPDRWAGTLLAAAGGVLATLSYAGGVLAWPIFLLGFGLLGFRRKRFYAACLLIGALSCLPYLSIPPNPYSQLHSLFDFPLLVKSLGWAFWTDFADPRVHWMGYLGLAVLAAAFFLLWKNRRWLQASAIVPSLLLILYGLANLWQITLFRDYLWTWYSPVAMNVWLGIAGLAYGFWRTKATEALGLKAWGFWAIAITLVLNGYTTFAYPFLDRSLALTSRAPASASCLRRYAEAPTYCQLNVIWWRPRFLEVGDMGRLLERFGLAVFAKRQQWSLQGDFAFPSVQVKNAQGVPSVFWSRGPAAVPAPWDSFEHLDLFLHTPDRIEWRFALPGRLKRAVFRSAVAISPAAPVDPQSDGVLVKLVAREAGGGERLLYSKLLGPQDRRWQDFAVSLDSFAGETLVLELSSDPRGNVIHDWLMFRWPHIDLELDEAEARSPASEILPANTDLSPDFPARTRDDFDFGPAQPDNWRPHHLFVDETRPPGEEERWIAGRDPYLVYAKPLSLCLADYGYAYFRMAAPILKTWAEAHAARLYFQFDGRAEFRMVTVPLIYDEAMHGYVFDLKLLEQGAKTQLTGLRIDPVIKEATNGPSWVRLSELSLIRKPGPSRCGP